MPAEVAAAAYGRVDALARRLREHDARTLDQLRADVYSDLLLGRDPGAAVPEAAATVFIHLPVDTALTMSEAGCHRPAQRADFDHLQEWAGNGETAVTNGGAKCERDHYRKDVPGWIYTHDPASGTTAVTTPGGHTYGKIPATIIEPRHAGSNRPPPFAA